MTLSSFMLDKTSNKNNNNRAILSDQSTIIYLVIGGSIDEIKSALEFPKPNSRFIFFDVS